MNWTTFMVWIGVFASAGWGYAFGFVRGYDYGADASLCVMGYLLVSQEEAQDLPACERARKVSNTWSGRLLNDFRALEANASKEPGR